jgi:hypothetical protein
MCHTGILSTTCIWYRNLDNWMNVLELEKLKFGNFKITGKSYVYGIFK